MRSAIRKEVCSLPEVAGLTVVSQGVEPIHLSNGHIHIWYDLLDGVPVLAATDTWGTEVIGVALVTRKVVAPDNGVGGDSFLPSAHCCKLSESR